MHLHSFPWFFVKSATLLLIASFFIGLGSVAAQVLVPLVSYLSSENARGRVVGNVMSGLLLGIMLARPISSLVADIWGMEYNICFICYCNYRPGVCFIESTPLQENQQQKTNYIVLLNSMWQLLRTTPILRRRAIYHACVFGAFSLFWTTVPLLLSSPAFHFFSNCHSIVCTCGNYRRDSCSNRWSTSRSWLDTIRHWDSSHRSYYFFITSTFYSK